MAPKQLRNSLHKVLGHLDLPLFDGSLDGANTWVGGLVGGLLLNVPHSIVQRVQVRGGGGPEICQPEVSKVGLAELLHLLGRVAGSPILDTHIVTLWAIGLQP